MNPLTRYRQAQRRLRALFDPFTRKHCPSCSTPCCRQPVLIRPVDLLLAQECGGFTPKAADCAVAVQPLLAAATGATDDGAGKGSPCEFLGPSGCTFPNDLRPFGCSAFICEPMRRLLPVDELSSIEAAVANLEIAHTRLMEALHVPSPPAASGQEDPSALGGARD